MRRLILPGIACLVASIVTHASAADRPGGAEPAGEMFGPSTAPAGPADLPPGFQESVVFQGLSLPTAVAFASDGRVFVAEQGGKIKVFDGLSDPVPTVFVNLGKRVYGYWDRGLLGLALHPQFPTVPIVYVLYTLDAPIGGQPPVWNDECPDPLGDGCLSGARLSRMRANGNVVGSKERVLIEGWCQQYTSHSIGMIGFGPDGALYATGGDGASFVFADYGQGGDPVNPCGDPGGPSPTPPTAEGGALRSQDLRTAGDPTGLNGTFIRVDAMTGAALPDNPLYGGAIADDDRIVASGMRNPFRFAERPGTDQLFIGDVGWTLWEEINRLNDVNDGVVENFGWPCYEGSRRQPDYDATNLDVCEGLYGEPGAVTAPLYAYHHERQVVNGENCPVGSSVISAMTFYAGGAYPDEYDGALFFGDHSRNCLWVMFPGLNGEPDPATRATFLDGASYPVDLKIGPDGDLFYVDYDEGQVHRISYTG